MKYIQNMKMVRKAKSTEKVADSEVAAKEESNFEKFPVCGTSTGWFSDRCRSSRHSEIQENLGVGVSTYFKQLKTLVIMLAVFTLFSTPAYVLFWSAGKIQSASTDAGNESMVFTDVLFGLSMGNLGQKETFSLAFSPNKQFQKVSLYCNTGVIGQVKQLGYA